MRSTVRALGRFTSPPFSFEPSRAFRSNLGAWALLAAVLLTTVSWAATPPQLGFAYFYKPPTDGTPASFVAQHFQLILLTHGDEAYAATLRRAGYAGPILQYVAPNEVEGPGPYANARAKCDAHYVPFHRTVADRPGVFCRQIHPHESWFLHNRSGQRIDSRWQSADGVWRTGYEMNPASRGWRQFVIARLRQYRSHLPFDGFFLDNVDLSRSRFLSQKSPSGGLAEFSTDAQFRTAVAGYLDALRKALPHVPLWANLTEDPDQPGGWSAYLPFLDGVMVEDFALGWKTFALPPPARMAQLSNIQTALRQGKKVLLVAQGAGHDAARRRFTLALAWALLPAHGGLYYRYNDSHTNDYRQVWWSPWYGFTPPQATAPLHCAGTVCTRRYPGGSVRFDLARTRLKLPPHWFSPPTPARAVRHREPLPDDH